MISSGTRISDLEEYVKANLTGLHNEMISGGVPFSIVSETDSISMSLVDFFLNSLDTDKLADLNSLEFEILKRNVSIKIAKVVMFACNEAKE